MPTLTPHSDDAPSPRVEVFFDESEWAAGTDTITVLQSSDAGTLEVRNASSKPAAGGFFVVDYEVPVGIPVSYRAQMFDSAGVSLGLSTAASTQVDIDTNDVMLSVPLAPKLALRVDAEESFAAALKRTRPLSVYRAGLSTIALMGPQGLLEDVPISVNTFDVEDPAKLDAIMATGVVLVRTMPSIPLPPLLYLAAPQVVRSPKNVAFGGNWALWDLTGYEVSRDLIEVLAPVVTYALFKAFFATYGDAKTNYATYLDAKRNPPPEA